MFSVKSYYYFFWEIRRFCLIKNVSFAILIERDVI